MERVQDSGTPGFYSWLFLVPKKSGKLCPVIDLSLLNQYIKKQPFKMETVRSVDNSQRPGCLHRSDVCVSSHSNPFTIQKIPSFQLRTPNLPIHGLTLWNVPKSVDFHKINGRNSSALVSACHISISIPRRLADKRFDSQPTNLSDNILPSNSTKSRFHTKSKEVRFDTNTEIHFYKHGISDSTEYSQVPADRVDSLILTIITFLSQSQVLQELSFLFWANSVQQQTSFY